MNHCVPEFEMDDEYTIHSSSAQNRTRKSTVMNGDDDIMELLWQDGQVVVQSQNQRPVKKFPASRYDAVPLPDQSAPREIRPATHELQPQNQNLFMQEDEMASWLHYPLNDAAFDQDFCADLLYPTPPSSAATATVNAPARPPQAAALPASSSRPPIPQPRRTEAEPRRTEAEPRRTEAEPRAVQNFAYFSRHKAAARAEPGPSSSRTAAREATVVESCETPAVGEELRFSEAARSAAGGNVGGCRPAAGIAAASSAGGKESTTYDLTYSPGCSSASASAEPAHKPPAEDRKRKGREAAAAADDTEYHSEDIEFESADAKKQARGSSSTKRSRAAEVHNLSERRRRDRINEKMKALQELIPRCNKSDKASMLDEAIEYLKSLQLQVQMMSMGCSMVPMMFPGVQQYMPPMGLGMGMRMGMGLEMGMNRPMMHFPNVLPGSALPPPAPQGHIPPRFPVPSYPMPPPDQARINQSDPGIVNNPLSMQNVNQQRVPNFPDPYQQYLGFHQMQFPPTPQNQGMAQPSTTRGAENRESDQPG